MSANGVWNGLAVLHELLIKRQPTAFERELLECISLYTRAAATTNVSDRLGHQTDEQRVRYRHLYPSIQETAIRRVFG